MSPRLGLEEVLMNSEKMNSLCVLGAYVKGTFDSAASRGVLTPQNIQTMVNSLIGLYGTDQFAVQEVTPAGSGRPLDIAEAVKQAAQKTAKTAEQSQTIAEELKKTVGAGSQ